MIITTNIRLPQEQWKALKLMAVHADTSVSALVRQAIGQLLGTSHQQPLPSTKLKRSKPKQDPFFDVIGLGSGGPSDDSIHHDSYLYPKK